MNAVVGFLKMMLLNRATQMPFLDRCNNLSLRRMGLHVLNPEKKDPMRFFHIDCNGRINRIAIRFAEGKNCVCYAPWVEKCVKNAPHLNDLYAAKDGKWCNHLVRTLRKDDRRNLVDALLIPKDSEILRKLEPVGCSEATIVKSFDDVLHMARDILCALTFLHGKGYVHRDVRLPNIIRLPGTEIFVLIDLETAGRIDKTGSANMPPESVVKRRIVELAGGISEAGVHAKRWHPVFDLQLFINSALKGVLHQLKKFDLRGQARADNAIEELDAFVKYMRRCKNVTAARVKYVEPDTGEAKFLEIVRRGTQCKCVGMANYAREVFPRVEDVSMVTLSKDVSMEGNYVIQIWIQSIS